MLYLKMVFMSAVMIITNANELTALLIMNTLSKLKGAFKMSFRTASSDRCSYHHLLNSLPNLRSKLFVVPVWLLVTVTSV